MRITPALLCFSILFSAVAAADPAPSSPTDAFLAARDRAVAAHPSDDKAIAAAQARLEPLLRAAVAAWKAPGFPATGAINLSAYDDPVLGFSALNGLVYNAGDSTVVVSNRALLLRWLADRRGMEKKPGKMPLSVPAAFRAADFWTFALGSDAAAELYGMVLVKAPAGSDVAMVQLAEFAQDLAMDHGPSMLVVAVVAGDRVFVASQKLTAKLEPPLVCKKDLDQTLAKSAAALKAYQASLKDQPAGKAKDASRFNEHIALDEKADREYRACFAQHLREQPNYALVQKQAQALVGLLH